MTVYIQPSHFIDSPQQFEGRTERLASSLVWFAAITIIENSDGKVARTVVPLDDWEEYISAHRDTDRLQALYNNIISARTSLKLGDRVLRFDQPQVMGILNITPDSFSDGGQFTQGDDMDRAAADAGHTMARDGAAIIDIGGESTRPGAKVIWEGDEAARILPAIEFLAGGGAIISVDTRKAGVMQQVLNVTNVIINDISALGYDERSVGVVRDSDAPVILMHAPSQGDDPHEQAQYDNVIFDVYDALERRVAEIEAAGIDRSKIMIDPGIGFGKNLSENLSLINGLSLFHAIGCPIIFGASRKRLIGALSNEAAANQRLGGSLYLAMKAIEQGVHIVRVHDVFETVQAVRVWRGIRDAALTAPA